MIHEDISPRERKKTYATQHKLPRHFPTTECGPALIEHSLRQAGFPPNAQVGKGFDVEKGTSWE